MDLRGFSSRHAGCVYELQQLMTALPAASIVLVYDGSTDVPVLARLLGEAWDAGVKAAGPRSGMVSLVRVDRSSPRELDAVTERLLGGGAPQQVLTSARSRRGGVRTSADTRDS